MSELDVKQQVLVSIYLEYQKDRPQMENIKADTLNLDDDIFIIALNKLQSEGLIKGAAISQTIGGMYMDESFNRFMMTREGIEYVETKLDIDKRASGPEKIKGVLAKTSTWGLEQIKDLAAKTLAEIANHQIDKYS